MRVMSTLRLKLAVCGSAALVAALLSSLFALMGRSSALYSLGSTARFAVAVFLGAALTAACATAALGQEVPNLMTYFKRQDKALPASAPYQPGGVVAWRLPNGLFQSAAARSGARRAAGPNRAGPPRAA